jgi:hypothetical protein
MQYLLTIKLNFGEFDDVAAREKARRIISELKIPEENISKQVEFKLQRLQLHDVPQGIKL